MTIVLTPEVERELTSRAQRQGTTPDLLADTYLRERLFADAEEERSANGRPRTLAERLKGYVGVLSSSEHVPGGAQMSERTGEQFTQILLERQAEGRL
ncbi:hypothetical protein [Longimicrobium sp.]|uniref:hypothetical protein n=1 Tax=Longimicrobium sp. TaxID=2029185 RepID=UPI002E3213B0|nr:hypothetical protein [Longimicrobium sp.]